jgi:hypothetical protein
MEEEEEELKQKNVSFLHFRNGTLTRLCVCVSVSLLRVFSSSFVALLHLPPTHTHRNSHCEKKEKSSSVNMFQPGEKVTMPRQPLNQSEEIKASHARSSDRRLENKQNPWK